MNFFMVLIHLPARGLIAFLRIYQRAVSPFLPAIFGSACGCRFAPTCSHYAIDAVRTHGAVIGAALAAVRLIKCTPLHPGGFDPVPPRGKFYCTLVPSSRTTKADQPIS